jgi:hypothetical protein
MKGCKITRPGGYWLKRWLLEFQPALERGLHFADDTGVKLPKRFADHCQINKPNLPGLWKSSPA